MQGSGKLAASVRQAACVYRLRTAMHQPSSPTNQLATPCMPIPALQLHMHPSHPTPHPFLYYLLGP